MSVCERTYRELFNLSTQRFYLEYKSFQGKRMEKLPELTWEDGMSDVLLAGQLSGVKDVSGVYARGRLACPQYI